MEAWIVSAVIIGWRPWNVFYKICIYCIYVFVFLTEQYDSSHYEKTHQHSILQVPTTQLAKMSIDPKFVELTADDLGIFLYNMRVPPLVCVFFPGVFLGSRVTGACPVTTDLIMRVNMRTTTIVQIDRPKAREREHTIAGPPPLLVYYSSTSDVSLTSWVVDTQLITNYPFVSRTYVSYLTPGIIYRIVRMILYSYSISYQ